MLKKPQMEYFKPVVLLHQTILLWCFLVSSVTSQSGIVKSTSVYQYGSGDLKQLLTQGLWSHMLKYNKGLRLWAFSQPAKLHVITKTTAKVPSQESNSRNFSFHSYIKASFTATFHSSDQCAICMLFSILWIKQLRRTTDYLTRTQLNK